MQLHARLTAAPAASGCRALVAGFGFPGRRDLDFGERFVRYAETLDWPEGVVVEDLSYAAHLALHRLQELRPAKLLLVGAAARGADPPGTLRRYRVASAPAPPEQVHASLVQAFGGETGLDHLRAVVRHWGRLPADTVVLEVEAADPSFGPGFSEELDRATDRLLDAVRDELGDPARLPPSRPMEEEGAVPDQVPGIGQLFEYADAHAQTRSLEALSARLPRVRGLAVASRFEPATRIMRTSGNWYELVRIDDGTLGVAVGDVDGCGVEAASTAARLRTAARALALVDGRHPAALVEHLDRFAESTGTGRGSALVYAVVDGRRGDVVLANAGHRRPVVVTAGGTATVDGGQSARLGHAGGAPRPEASFRLSLGSTLLLLTKGVAEDALRRALAAGTDDVDALCERAFGLRDHRAGPAEDASLLALRLTA